MADMGNNNEIDVKSILDWLSKEEINFRFDGDASVRINGFSSAKNYKKGTVTWVKTKKAVNDSVKLASLIIAEPGIETENVQTIYCENSKRAFFIVVEKIYDALNPVEKSKSGVGEYTVIGENVKLGENVKIGSFCVLDGNITIGDNVKIGHNVTIINNVAIGDNTEIQSGCVIGHDGFGYYESGNKKTMIKHFGGVFIGKDVRIGANSVICRGTIDNTQIGDGCKIDGLCFVAHNVIIGKDSAAVTGTALFGSSEIGENSYIASALIRNQTHVGENAFIGMGAVVTKDVAAGTTVMGVPAKERK